MQKIIENKTFFIRITLGLSEAAAQSPAKDAWRKIIKATSKCASKMATTV
jgi:hypothetical protein